MNEVVEAWSELKAAAQRFGRLAIDANHFARIERIVHHEVETNLRQFASDWSSKQRRLVRWLAGKKLPWAIESAQQFASFLLRKYLGHDQS